MVKIGVSANGKDLLFANDSFAYHGLIAGGNSYGRAVGTTTTAQLLAEQLSENNIPVLVIDMDGDLAGQGNIDAVNRKSVGNAVYWDINGTTGISFDIAIDLIDAHFIGKLLALTEKQTDILRVVLKVACENKLRVYDMKDLKAIISLILENKVKYSNDILLAQSELNKIYIRVSAFLNKFSGLFSEKPTNPLCMINNSNGYGEVHYLNCRQLQLEKDAYLMTVFYVLNSLMHKLPVGDYITPKQVIFIDEADCLFMDADAKVIEIFESLFSSLKRRGVAVWLIARNTELIPSNILCHIRNYIIHSMNVVEKNKRMSVSALLSGIGSGNKASIIDMMQNMDVGDALISIAASDGTGGPMLEGHIDLPRRPVSRKKTGQGLASNIINPFK